MNNMQSHIFEKWLKIKVFTIFVETFYYNKSSFPAFPKVLGFQGLFCFLNKEWSVEKRLRIPEISAEGKGQGKTGIFLLHLEYPQLTRPHTVRTGTHLFEVNVHRKTRKPRGLIKVQHHSPLLKHCCQRCF